MSFFVKLEVFERSFEKLVNDFGWDPKDHDLVQLFSLVNSPTIVPEIYFTKVNDQKEPSHWIISGGANGIVHIYNNDTLIACFGFIFAFANDDFAYAFNGDTILKALDNIKGTKMLTYPVWRMLNSVSKNETYYIYRSGEGEFTRNNIYTYFNVNKKFVTQAIIPQEFINILLHISKDKIRITAEQINDLAKEINNKKENDTTMKMPTIMNNLDFGPITSGVQMSPVGPAIQKGNQWLSYNSNTEQTVDVTGITFDFPGMIFKVPVATTAIKKGDIVIHQNKPMFVTGIVGTRVEAIDIMASEEKIIIPVTNIFGFNFITKITSFMNFDGMAPSPDQPFGNIMPFLAMSMLFNKDDEGNSDENLFGGMNMEKMFMMFAVSSMFNPNNNNNPFAQMFNFGATIAPKTPDTNPKNTSDKENNN